MSKLNAITVLYVDDEPINLMLFEKCFMDKFTIKCAESGPVALKILDGDPTVSVIISDMKMPEMNGIEFIRKAKERLTAIPCYILTGYEVNEEISEALDDKLIIRCFTKPFNMELIESAIKSHID